MLMQLKSVLSIHILLLFFVSSLLKFFQFFRLGSSTPSGYAHEDDRENERLGDLQETQPVSTVDLAWSCTAVTSSSRQSD